MHKSMMIFMVICLDSFNSFSRVLAELDVRVNDTYLMDRESVNWKSLSKLKVKFGCHSISSFVLYKCP